jgi:hypothetical protein
MKNITALMNEKLGDEQVEMEMGELLNFLGF